MNADSGHLVGAHCVRPLSSSHPRSSAGISAYLRTSLFALAQGDQLAPDVPILPQMRPLTLDDCDWLRGLFWDLQPQQSEFTFTNLFMWRDAYALRLCRLDDAVLVFSWRPDPEDSFLFPPIGAGATAETVRRGLAVLAEAGHAARLERVTRQDLDRLGLAETEFAVEPRREQWDYVYRVQDLIGLSGNRYHDKRNHIEQFRRVYQFTYRPLTAELVPQCQELQDRWCDEKHCDLQATLRAEGRAVKEVLSNFELLCLKGGCIEVNGRVEAFTLGEMLNVETVVIHAEKANADFHGLYQVINQQFLEHEWASVPFVNREQDLGVPGLRRSKESYNPHHMVEKYEVRAQ